MAYYLFILKKIMLVRLLGMVIEITIDFLHTLREDDFFIDDCLTRLGSNSNNLKR